MLEPNLANQIAARVTLVQERGAKETAEEKEGRGALYHGYVEGEKGRGAMEPMVKLFKAPIMGLDCC